MKLYVDMFGEFTIYADGEPAFRYEGRTRKLWNLLQYLFIKRGTMVPQSDLIAIAHLDGRKGKPENSLKNLIYRLRSQLENSDLPKQNYIICERGAYAWNPNIPVTLDVEVFEQEWKEACALEHDSENRLIHYLAAIELYKGKFLPQSQSEEWVQSLEGYYHHIFADCVNGAYEIFKEKKDMGFMEELCRKSLNMDPLSEELCRLYINVLIQQNQYKRALSVYSAFVDRLQKEADQRPSEAMIRLYQDVIKMISNMQADINMVKNDLKEASAGNGAYYCQYEIFKNMYRLLARSISRTGQPVYLLLFTVSDANGDMPTVKMLHSAMRALQLGIGKSLRRGDVYAQYSNTQYVVLLQSLNEENGRMIANRVISNYEQIYQNKKVVVNHMLQEMEPVDAPLTIL
jgi:DNA-binding SARP family transcriptional activator